MENEYKYTSPLTSPFYNHVISPLCEYTCHQFLPASITPNSITVAGLVSAFIGATLISQGYFISGAFFWLLYSVCDNLDGKQARDKKMSSAAGEFLDHVIDSSVSTLLAAVLVGLLLPPCLKQSNIFHTQEGRPLQDSYTPYLVLLSTQVPFYLGTVAYLATGRILIGNSIDNNFNWITVDEINIIIVPFLAVLRSFIPQWWEKTVTTVPSFVPFGHMCHIASDGAHILTYSSIFVGLCLCLVTIAVLRVGRRVSSMKHANFFFTLATYTILIMLFHPPLSLILPCFTWLCSCIIFQKCASRYTSLHYAAKDQSRARIYLKDSLPVIAPWQVRQRFALALLMGGAVATWCVRRYTSYDYRPVITGLSAVAYILSIWTVFSDVSWLVKSESIRIQHADA